MANEPSKPNFSNVQSGAGTTAPPPPKADFGNVAAGVDSTAKVVAPKTYTVAKGDSLSKISKHLYGNANRWKEIFEANRDQLENPDLIQPGQILKLPADAGPNA
ncbi:MAG: LysM peptidoglycan-binding domain-containing protein [Dokdonella sp.]|uniref:LysM peptidoglycan-binding domain-containing protein n=1 Tax=Dokdonella sp. TaxID=2291710 RepID=UPI003267B4C7